MGNCCGQHASKDADCQIRETDSGVNIEIKTKDASKIDSLKSLLKACRDFCGC